MIKLTIYFNKILSIQGNEVKVNNKIHLPTKSADQDSKCKYFNHSLLVRSFLPASLSATT
jgi:hypothetical protein